jgi:tetratricopeptide (TPR) repeat protein
MRLTYELPKNKILNKIIAEMNIINSNNKIGLNYKRSMKEARIFFKKNRLHESLSIINRLRHHGYDEPELILFAAQVYDRLTLLTSEAEYEELAMETFNEIIRYSDNKKYIKKAVKLQNTFMKRISALDENEFKAQSKAEELKSTRNMSPKAWFILGANFSVRKDPLFVINALNNAIVLNDKYISALYRLAYVYQYNMNDKNSALSLYLKVIKIQPYEDNIESESTNVKTILEACTEISGIYMFDDQYKKAISVFDHAFKLVTAYGDICSIHTIKKIISNAYASSMKLNNLPALKKHVMKNFGYDFDSILEELRIN